MKFFNKVIILSRKVIFSLENSKAPFAYFVLSFFFAATVRNFLEIFSDNPQFSEAKFFLHYYLSYIALVMTSVLLIHLLTKTEIVKIAKVALPSFIVLSLAPLLDLLLSGGKGYDIAYLLPGVHHNLALRFFTFFGDFPGLGVTPGMRIEIGLGLIGAFIYFYSKKISLVKSVVSTALVYLLIFSYIAIPFIIRALFEPLGLNPVFSNSLLIRFYLVVIFLAGIVLTYLLSKKYFKAILEDIRLLRLLSYETMFFLGVLIGLKYFLFEVDQTTIFSFILIPISIAFAWLFSVFVNNIEDYEIDKISNKERPLFNQEIDREIYKKIGWLFLGLSLIFALAVNFETLFLILLFIGNYFFYSARPLRLKRVPILSKLIIAFNALILLALGFLIITESIYKFPIGAAVIFLVSATAVANFIDLKDHEGDKKAGIKTLPVILGVNKAKLVIGLLFVLAYLLVYFLIEKILGFKSFSPPFFFYLFLLGLTQFYLINRKEYKEKYIFFVFLFSLIIIIILFFL